MSSGASFPFPTHSSVPTMVRTMLRRKPSPAMCRRISPRSSRSSHRCTVRTVVRVSCVAKVAKSWRPTR